MSSERAAVKDLPRLEWRLLVALVYCALVLTILEYWFLPARVLEHGWLRAVPARRDLMAGLIWAGATSFFFLVVPALVVRLWHRDPLASVGFSMRGFSRHILVYLGLYGVMIPVVWIVSQRPDFQRTYPFVRSALSDTSVLVIWESAYVFQFFALESFFRGYLLFTASAVLPRAAIAVSAVPYTMIHFHKPFPECVGALFAGLLLGFLALRYRSFWGGVVLHALVAVTMDVVAVARAAR